MASGFDRRSWANGKGAFDGIDWTIYSFKYQNKYSHLPCYFYECWYELLIDFRLTNSCWCFLFVGRVLEWIGWKIKVLIRLSCSTGEKGSIKNQPCQGALVRVRRVPGPPCSASWNWVASCEIGKSDTVKCPGKYETWVCYLYLNLILQIVMII